MIYLDNNATTPVDIRVLKTMIPYFSEVFGNSSSTHLFGLTVNEAVEDAQEKVSDLFNAKPREITFTSGATEGINLAIKGLINSKRKTIITVATEHKAVLDTCIYMEEHEFIVKYLPVQRDGLIDINLLKDAINDDTLLVSVMLTNNETGVLQSIKQIAEIAHINGAFFMTDATQAAGKLEIDVKELGIDFMAFSAHKFYGPKGIGGLYVSADAKIKLEPQIHGGGHQRNIRSGTLNVPGIIGLGKACEIAKTEMAQDAKRIENLRNNLESELLKIEGTFVNGNKEFRLYNTTNICFPGVSSESLIIGLKDIAVSNGSACTAVVTTPSHVLTAMGLNHADALASIRFSLGKLTTATEIEITIDRVTELVNQLRS